MRVILSFLVVAVVYLYASALVQDHDVQACEAAGHARDACVSTIR